MYGCASLGHDLKESSAKGVTDLNTDPLNPRQGNATHDQEISWFKHWSGKCLMSEWHDIFGTGITWTTIDFTTDSFGNSTLSAIGHTHFMF